MKFAERRIYFFIISFLVITPGIFFLITNGGLNTGIDFKGGSSMTLSFPDGVSVSQTQIRSSLLDIGYSDTTIQNLGNNSFFLRTTELDDNEKSIIEKNLITNFTPQSASIITSYDLVSPVVANETVIAAGWAVLAAVIGIFIYIWWAFRNIPNPFRYGIAAIIALVHDAIIVIGSFAILGEFLGIEISTMFLVALLTIIGYSVNDTIVVFDKIRENVLIYTNRKFTEVVNLSISETLGRSLNTSFTLLLTLLALFLFGGATIREFLYVLIIGVVAGTYSSIAIASQILVVWDQKKIGSF
ncbi:MAG: protein translocase subunit SecF [SAR202 cluster bacterium]|nr:protein translocase subunit SecF [SAR202 cluster bacterium]